jgi:hypothetical protein
MVRGVDDVAAKPLEHSAAIVIYFAVAAVQYWRE